MDFLSKIFGGSVTSIVDSVGDALDKITTTKEEKLQHELESKQAEYAYNIEMKRLGLEEDKLDVENTKSAREIYNQSKSTADKLAVRIMNWNLPFLLIIVGANIACVKYFDSVLLAIISNIIGQVIQMLINERLTVINFFFGSSIGSKDKTNLLNSK
jgi:hypothetical protein